MEKVIEKDTIKYITSDGFIITETMAIVLGLIRKKDNED